MKDVDIDLSLVSKRLKALKQELVSSHADGFTQDSVRKEMLMNFLFLYDALDLEKNLTQAGQKVIERFAGRGHDQANLVSPAASERISKEIGPEFKGTLSD